MENYKTYRIETMKGEIVSDGYGTLSGAKLDARDLQKEFSERLFVFDENNDIYDLYS